MIDLLLENTIEVISLEEGDEPLWERFLTTALRTDEKNKTSCIIDAGAVLGGK